MGHSIISSRAVSASNNSSKINYGCGESKLKMLRESSKSGIMKRLEASHCSRRKGSSKKGVAFSSTSLSSSSSCTTDARTVSPIKPSCLSLEQLGKYDDLLEKVGQEFGGGGAGGGGTSIPIFRTLLWLFICSLMTGGTFGAEPFNREACNYPDPVEFAAVRPTSPVTRGGLYPNGSRAHVDCYSNFRVKYGDPSLTCVNGVWMGTGGRAVECGKCLRDLIFFKECITRAGASIRSCNLGDFFGYRFGTVSIGNGVNGSFPELLHPASWATICGQYPKIDRGFYGPLASEPAGNSFQEDGYPVGSELQADCISTYTLNCTHPYRNLCGRISCQPDGRWVPKDGNLVTGCVPKPAVQPVNGDDDRHGPRTSSSLKNYLVLALVLVCIFVVGALTVALIRRPLFCKKREQNQGDGQGVVCQGGQSPNHQQFGADLDSLPVAMNTGIFLPGAGYDLQDCQMQDVAFVGTTVFK